VVGVPFVVHVRGDASLFAPVVGSEADSDPAVGFGVVSAGVSCPSSYAELVALDQGAWHWAAGDPASAPFDVSLTVLVDEPGSVGVCAWFGFEGELDLEVDAGASGWYYAPFSVEVARPSVVGSAVLSGSLRPGADVSLTASFSSSALVMAAVFLQRGVCGGNVSAASVSDVFQEGFSPVQVMGSGLVFRRGVVLPDELGSFRLCVYGYREGHEGDPDLVVDAGGVVVSRPVVSQGLALPGRLFAGGEAVLSGVLSSDWPVSAEVFLNLGGQACRGSASVNAGFDRFAEGVDVLDVPAGELSVSQTVLLPDVPGSYHLCVYAARDGHEQDPDLVVDAGRVSVVRPVVSAGFSFVGGLFAGSQVLLTGRVDSDVPVYVDVYLNDSAAACRATSSLDVPFDEFLAGLSGLRVPAGGVDVRQSVILPERVGDYRLCVYGYSDGGEDNPELVLDLGVVSVVRARVSADFSLEGFLVAASFVRLVADGSSDYPVLVTVMMNHRDKACASNAASNDSADLFVVPAELMFLSGGPVRLSSTVQLPELAGTYHLCTYAAREGADDDPDLVFDSASRPGGLYFVDVQSVGIGELVYADGSHGTFQAGCRLSDRRPVYRQKLRISCPGVTGTIRFSYRRVAPRRMRAQARTLRVSEQGTAAKSTGGLYPGLYRVQIKWKGWVIHKTTVRVRHTINKKAKAKVKAKTKTKAKAKAGSKARRSLPRARKA
jgi:hypothetical protein